jgi:hypothetical protein
MNRLGTTLLVLLGWVSASQATTLVRTSLDDLIAKSSAIVRGRVVETSAVMRGSTIQTTVKVQVLERLKGSYSTTVDLVLPGGTVPGFRQRVTGVPELHIGEEHVFFLWTAPSGMVRLYGLAQGLLDLSTDAQGNSVVARGMVDAVLLNSRGTVVQDEPFSMKMSDFRSRLARSLDGAKK